MIMYTETGRMDGHNQQWRASNPPVDMANMIQHATGPSYYNTMGVNLTVSYAKLHFSQGRFHVA